MVAHPQTDYPLQLEIEHHSHLSIPHLGRLRILCLPGSKRLHGINRLHDTPLKRYRIIPLRRPALPREKPQEQSHRPPPGPAGPILPAYWFSAIV